MVIMVDTNILVDVIANRELYVEYAKSIMEKCAGREITGIIASPSITRPGLYPVGFACYMGY